jgi:hypothetical protein
MRLVITQENTAWLLRRREQVAEQALSHRNLADVVIPIPDLSTYSPVWLN